MVLKPIDIVLAKIVQVVLGIDKFCPRTSRVLDVMLRQLEFRPAMFLRWGFAD